MAGVVPIVTEPEDGNSERSLSQMQLLSNARALITRRWEKMQGRQRLLTPEVTRRLGGDQLSNRFRASALVVSAVSCLDAATDAWIESDGAAPMADLLGQEMDALNDPC
ncbi:hypothetical protein MUN78_11865 [Leucobacter allii]|uniref:MftR C-terminal domain-containing protein n=1 Tax=Leucobacter allii TaxID=2932247 RepID=A0ABY4FIJ1_9MICO|nr:hypothetical protein [Leucobacter allii]UOQ56370.1 hypothetical protein MUN78_11865 [Leucobacter allii]